MGTCTSNSAVLDTVPASPVFAATPPPKPDTAPFKTHTRAQHLAAGVGKCWTSLGRIFGFLDGPSLASCSRVSRLHHRLLQDDIVWARLIANTQRTRCQPPKGPAAYPNHPPSKALYVCMTYPKLAMERGSRLRVLGRSLGNAVSSASTVEDILKWVHSNHLSDPRSEAGLGGGVKGKHRRSSGKRRGLRLPTPGRKRRAAKVLAVNPPLYYLLEVKSEQAALQAAAKDGAVGLRWLLARGLKVTASLLKAVVAHNAVAMMQVLIEELPAQALVDIANLRSRTGASPLHLPPQQPATSTCAASCLGRYLAWVRASCPAALQRAAMAPLTHPAPVTPLEAGLLRGYADLATSLQQSLAHISLTPELALRLACCAAMVGQWGVVTAAVRAAPEIITSQRNVRYLQAVVGKHSKRMLLLLFTATVPTLKQPSPNHLIVAMAHTLAPLLHKMPDDDAVKAVTSLGLHHVIASTRYHGTPVLTNLLKKGKLGLLKKLLLSRPTPSFAGINTRAHKGDTLLRLACKKELPPALISLLLQAGADPHIANFAGADCLKLLRNPLYEQGVELRQLLQGKVARRGLPGKADSGDETKDESKGDEE